MAIQGAWGDAKPIETVFHGHKFRSRLEARYAVLLDHLGVNWDYEPEGFDLDGVRYLPDFWLPALNCFLEIKPTAPVLNSDEWTKAEALSVHTKRAVYCFFGRLDRPSGEYGGSAGDGGYIWHDGDWDNGQMWCECPDCHVIDIRFEGRSNRLSCKEPYECAQARQERPDHYCDNCDGRCPRHGGNLDRGHTYDASRIVEAYRAARQARFEHGAAG